MVLYWLFLNRKWYFITQTLLALAIVGIKLGNFLHVALPGGVCD